MGKETFYFSHDYNSRSDPKMVKLLMNCGIEGIGIYWCIVEMLYEEGGYLLQTEYERIAFELRTDYERIEKIINTPLFKKDEQKFWSDSVLSRLKIRQEKSDTARKNIQSRWDKQIQSYNNGNTKNSNGNTIKESKVNKNKIGIKFNEEKTAVFFEDGTFQILGKSQKFHLEQNDLKPEQVWEGYIV